VRWWKLALGGALLAWVLGTAYLQARRRGRRIGLALLLLGATIVLFALAAFFPWPQQVSSIYPQAMVVSSILLLALSIAVVLWRGFRR